MSDSTTFRRCHTCGRETGWAYSLCGPCYREMVERGLRRALSGPRRHEEKEDPTDA